MARLTPFQTVGPYLHLGLRAGTELRHLRYASGDVFPGQKRLKAQSQIEGEAPAHLPIVGDPNYPVGFP